MSASNLLLPRKEGVRRYRHGYKSAGKYSSEYSIWMNMRSRCKNPKNNRYHLYGARGITVCERWETDFLNFLVDMGRRPSPAHSIDRIDNDGDYSPENCRWATRQEQSRNRRSSRFITHEGKRQTLADWAEEVGMSISALHARLKNGWPVSLALSAPLRGAARKSLSEEMRKATIFRTPEEWPPLD